MARPRIFDLLDRQGEALGNLEDREVRGFLRAYEDARRELAEDLERMVAQGLDQATPFTAQHMRVTLAQLEAGIKRLERRLEVALSTSVDKTRTHALQDLLRVVASQEPGFKDAGGRIEHEVLRRFTEDRGLLLHEHSIGRYGRDLVSRIQQELVVGVTREQTWRQVAKRIAGLEDSILAGMRHRAELIVRMELNGAYNGAHLTSIEEAGKVLDEAHPGDPLQKKADEFRDLRNHALSRVLDGQVQPPDQPFKVSVARVGAEHAALQAERIRRKLPPRRLTGILWEQQGAYYVGMNYPAHFWERGRIVPWRRSWEEHAVLTSSVRGGSPATPGRILEQINPVPDPRIVKQPHDAACGPAAGETLAKMLGASRVDRAGLMDGVLPYEEGGVGLVASELTDRLNRFARVRGRSWAGGAVGPASLDKAGALDLMISKGPFLALVEPSLNSRGHWLVVAGRDGDLLEILDPEGVKYSTPMVDFLERWPFVVVFAG